MSYFLPSGYAPIDRAEIQTRSQSRDDNRPIGRILIDVPGCSVDWTLHRDPRDVRRWLAKDYAGMVQAHAAWPTMLRELAAGRPQALGRRRW